MRSRRSFGLLSLALLTSFAPLARAQFIAVGGGGVFPKDLTAAPPSGQVAQGPASAEFSRSGMLAVDGGIGFFPFLTAGLHYSLSHPEMLLRRGDAFGSSARVDLDAHTLTGDLRLRTLPAFGLRLYGLGGVGFTRFTLHVKQTVEVPFPKGAPENVLAPVFTFGGGIEKSIFPFIHLKLEARDYVTPVPDQFFLPGGAWHRPAVIAGIVLGR